MAAVIGELCETQAEITNEWKIRDFSLLTKEVNVHYESPKFYFSGASWNMWLYPNGETEKNSDGWLGLYLMRMSTGSAVTINYSMRLKSVDRRIDLNVTDTDVFNEKSKGWGRKKIVLRSVLMEKKSELFPSDTLTIVCSVKNSNPNVAAGSLFQRYQRISDSFKEIFAKRNRTDCTLIVDGQSIAAHRMVLEARSPVFAAMFAHDTRENRTGEICIDDIEKSVLDYIIEFMYSGDIPKLTTEKALAIYAAAEKYDMQDVKDLCSDFIKSNLSVDWVCDVIKFADLYEIQEVGNHAREYFKENARRILKTEKWRTFAKENHDISVELLGCVVVAFLPE